MNHLFAHGHPDAGRSWTNAEVAAATGISESYIGYIRSGQRDNPTVRHLRRLAKHFGVPVSYLVDDEPHGDIEVQLRREQLSNTLDGALQRTDIQHLIVLLATMSADSVAALTSVADRLTRLERAEVGPAFPAGRPDRRVKNS